MAWPPKKTALRWIVWFSFQATVSSSWEADSTSRSPSPSRSPATAQRAWGASVARVRRIHDEPLPELFSYQASLLSPHEAESPSRSPSASRSAAETNSAALAWVLITCVAQLEPLAALFSYQVILLSSCEAESASTSPSPSISAAWTERAPSALLVRMRKVQPP